ncbi:MAG: RNA ligase family protein [Verrucomicrobiota bacterium]
MTTRHKYPRTPHLPWSPGASDDDVLLRDCARFEGKRVVVTEKMDGENTSLYRDGLHARSLDSRHHPSRDRVKAWHAAIAHEIPEGWRLCGENLYARHSIAYDTLPGYFFLLSVWNPENECLSWESTVDWARRLDCPLPAVRYQGLWDAAAIRRIPVDPALCEGYVVRLEGGFPHARFGQCAAKWVRPSHVTTDAHWMHGPVIPNRLRSDG